MEWGRRPSHHRSRIGQQQHLPRQWSSTWGLYSSRSTWRFYFFSSKWLMWVCILYYLLFYCHPSPFLQKRVTPVTHPESYYGVPKKDVSILGWRNLIILCWCWGESLDCKTFCKQGVSYSFFNKLKEDLIKLSADSSKKINFYNIYFYYFVAYNLKEFEALRDIYL